MRGRGYGAPERVRRAYDPAMEFPDHLRYSAEHEWVAVDGTRARIGITDFAQDALGDVVYVQLPDVGASVVANASLAEVESTKSVSEIYAPVTGTVVEVNQSLDDAPEQVNQDPYGAGWIFVLELADPAEVDTLMDAATYRAMVEAG
jgi:glycine cleavage system H protein